MKLYILRYIPNAIQYLEEVCYHEIDGIPNSYQDSRKGEYRQTPCCTSRRRNECTDLVYSALALIDVVGCDTYKGKTRASEEGEELHAPPRVEDADQAQPGAEEEGLPLSSARDRLA